MWSDPFAWLAAVAVTAAATPASLAGIVFFISRRGLTARNFRGQALPCCAGLALLGPIVLGYTVLIGMLPDLRPEVLGLVAVVLLGSLAGLVDDVAGEGEPKGLRGHLSALRRGDLTAGSIKACALGLAGLMGAAAANVGGGHGFLLALMLALLIIPLSANAFNALDLRPGRAVKVFLLVGVILTLGTWGEGQAGLLLLPLMAAALVYLPWDLRERSMLGDTGANALGAAIGMALTGVGPIAQVLSVLMLVCLHVFTERASISRLVESNRVLRRLDRWGRQQI